LAANPGSLEQNDFVRLTVTRAGGMIEGPWQQITCRLAESPATNEIFQQPFSVLTVYIFNTAIYRSPLYGKPTVSQ